MDAFDFDNAKVEKSNAMLQFHGVRNIAKLFRFVELCLALFFLSWTSTRLPFAVRISGEYIRQLITIIVSPLFIFLLCNVIVLTLLAKSGQFSPQSTAINNAETDPSEEFIKNSENLINFGQEDSSPLMPEPVEIVYQDKQIIFEVNTPPPPNYESTAVTAVTDTVPESKFYRSKSEKLKRRSSETPSEKLRRSETEKCRKVVSAGENPAETVLLVDALSNEEFQRWIDAFIAKQIRFHQEEKLAIVPHSHI